MRRFCALSLAAAAARGAAQCPQLKPALGHTLLPQSTEWLRGEELCTISGKYHLAWVIPMADATYYV